MPLLYLREYNNGYNGICAFDKLCPIRYGRDRKEDIRFLLDGSTNILIKIIGDSKRNREMSSIVYLPI